MSLDSINNKLRPQTLLRKKNHSKQSYEIQAVLKFKRMLFYESSSREYRPTWFTNKQEQTS